MYMVSYIRWYDKAMSYVPHYSRHTLSSVAIILAITLLAINVQGVATVANYDEKGLTSPLALDNIYIITSEEQAKQMLKALSSYTYISKPFIISIDLCGVSIQTAIDLIKMQAANGIVAAVLTGDPVVINKVLHQAGFSVVSIPDEVIVSDGVRILKANRIKTLTLGILYHNGKVRYYSSITGLNGKLINNINEVYKAILKDMRNIIKYYTASNTKNPSQATKTGSITITTTQANFNFTTYPYGKLYIRDVVGDLNDANPNYWWRYYQFRSQILPGVQVYGTEWRNAGIFNEIDVDYYSQQGFLSDYDPTTTSGTSSVSVALGASVSGDRDGVSPGVSLSAGWSHSISDVVVQDLSDFGQQKAKWIHHINPAALVGSSTYLAKPGVIFRFPEHGTYSWRVATMGQWAKKNCFLIFCQWDYTNFYGLAYKWTVTS